MEKGELHCSYSSPNKQLPVTSDQLLALSFSKWSFGSITDLDASGR